MGFKPKDGAASPIGGIKKRNIGMGKGTLKIKRIYESPEKTDGERFLVDRLWPRGISKEKAKLSQWLKKIAPSQGLREWYHHDIDRWPEFQKRYAAELKKNPQAYAPLLEALRQGKTVTLLFAAKEREHNNAVALRNFLLRKRK